MTLIKLQMQITVQEYLQNNYIEEILIRFMFNG